MKDIIEKKLRWLREDRDEHLRRLEAAVESLKKEVQNYDAYDITVHLTGRIENVRYEKEQYQKVTGELRLLEAILREGNRK